MGRVKTDLNELAETVIDLFPRLNREEQPLAVGLYRCLAEGRSVSRHGLSKAVQLPIDVVNRMLDETPGIYCNAEGDVIGFWGLALPETDHRFVIEGRPLYTWCAWDSLFIPQIIQKTADVESTCPVTGDKIRLTISPEKVEKLEPPGAVMSFVTPEAAKIREDVVQHFCHYVHFFYSAEAGLKWTSENDGTFILSIEEAYQLGRKKNQVQFREF